MVNVAVWLTFVLGGFLFASGAMSFVLAATFGRRTGRAAWLVITGFMDIILCTVVLLEIFAGAFWLLGLIVAVNLLFAGEGLVIIGLTWRVRRSIEAADRRDQSRANATFSAGRHLASAI